MTLTVLFTSPGKRACKIFRNGGVVPYDAGWHFEHGTLGSDTVNSIYTLASVLTSLETEPRAFVVRGAVANDAPNQIYRRAKPRQDQPPHLLDQALPWVCLDFDKSEVMFNLENPEACIIELLLLLPEAFRNVTCFAQLSASQHLSSTVRVHLWYWLDRPYSNQEIKRYLKASGSKVDLSLFHAVQPHYTAKPIFEDSEDPIPVRSFLIKAPLDFATIDTDTTDKLRETALAELNHAVKEIRSIKVGVARHPIVNRWAFQLAQYCPHLLKEKDVFDQLVAAATSSEDPLPVDRAHDEIMRAMSDGMGNPKLVGESWRGLLETKGKGFALAATMKNITTILAYDPRWQDVLSFDERSQNYRVAKNPPFKLISGSNAPRSLDESDDTRLVVWLDEEYGIKISPDICNKALRATCLQNSYDPVKDIFEDLEWDGKDRLYRLAYDYLQCPDPYAGLCIGKWLIAAVARTYEPGAQVDFVPVLEGPEGVGKTSFLRQLAFTTYYASVNLDVTNKDATLYIHGPLISDFSELGAFKKSEVSSIKDFLTRTYDRVRLPYKAQAVNLPRRGVFAATTNESDYLPSNNGNRRFVPVVCPKTIKHLNAFERDQLWAEARQRYLAGETWWQIESEELQEARSIRELDPFDPWQTALEQWLRARPRGDGVTIHDCLTLGLGVPLERVNAGASRRVGRVLRDLGWVQAPGRAQGRRWLPPKGWIHLVAQGA